jgi:O-antigen ligase
MTSSPLPVASARAASFRKHAPVLLVWSCLVLLPFGRLVEIPVLLMTAAGLVLLVRERDTLLAWPQLRTFAFVFAAMWLPILISLTDAVNPERTAVIALNHLRFFFSGVFMIWALADAPARERLLHLAGWLLVLWIVDAGVQSVFGVDLLGRGKAGEHITGMYGSTSRKLGTTLGVIVPLLWVFVQRRFSPWVLLAALLASILVLLSAGARAAWISVLVCLVLFAAVNRTQFRHLGKGVLITGVILALLLPVFAYVASPTFKSRLDESIGELSGTTPVEHSPLGHRAWIWKGALNMIAANPVNGVGARGFRDAFADYPATGDPFVVQDPPVLPLHSHQLLIEITAETGFIGLAGLLLAMGLLARAAKQASPAVRTAITPYGIALCAAFFPLNTHLAIYSAHWSQIVWWLIGVYCAYLCPTDRRSVASESAAS